MTEDLSGERLESVLRSVGRHLAIPPEADVLPLDLEPRRSNRTRRGLVIAAAAAIVVGVAVTIPSTRTAVADLLGIGSTRIEVDVDGVIEAASTTGLVEGLTAISTDEAVSILGTESPSTDRTALGAADSMYRMPEGGVLLVWEVQEATLWIQTTDIAGLYTKLIGADQGVEPVRGLGTAALLIEDAHILQTPYRRVMAGSVLLWTDDDRQYRFEANMTGDEMIRFGRDLS